LSSRSKTTPEPPAAQAIPDLWWEKEIPRWQAEISTLDSELARTTHGRTREKLKKRREVAQGELNNALHAAGVHARQTQDTISSVSVPATAATTVKLTDREKKIWEVIQRGAKGLLYCRELDNANITPPRVGVWKDGPRKYAAAYGLKGHWRHRIEDEKSKIRRKAQKAANLAGALASE
jgi:hypothetical protein